LIGSEAARDTLAVMDDLHVGAAFRRLRIRRRLRQEDVAAAAWVSRSLVSAVERGKAGGLSLDTLRRIGAVLDIRVELTPRWRGGELDRLLSRSHALLAEQVASSIEGVPGWVVWPEATFAIRSERGAIDLLAWHAASRHLLVVELKTAIVDANELLGTLDRKRRLAGEIGAQRRWDASRVSVWLVVADTRTNRRRVSEHRTLLRSQLPSDGRTFSAWLRDPTEPCSGVTFWTNDSPGSARQDLGSPQRVRAGRPRGTGPGSRSAKGGPGPRHAALGSHARCSRPNASGAVV
jgi:transcriptional regulator with XRE-family HTH domain